MVQCPPMHDKLQLRLVLYEDQVIFRLLQKEKMSGSLMGTRKGLVGNFRTIRKREGILLAGNQSILKKRRKKKEKNPTLGMTGIHGHRLSLAKAQPKIHTNGVAMDEVVIEIGTRVNTTTAADIRTHGRAPGFNGIRMTGDGKGEMV